MINVHVDVDNLWIYEKEFNIKIHPDREYVYLKCLPIFLRLLKKSNSKATFMVIGQDLELNAAQIFCKKAIADGHEIANHTYSHPISFGKLSFEQKKQEIIRAHKKITEVCEKKPVGFRGAGYFISREIIPVLQELKYQYDTSVLPGFAPFLMSAYALAKGGKNKHKTFAKTDSVFSKEKPYQILELKPSKETLLELPISVFPYFKLPIHTTFAYFFGPWYQKLILRYLASKPKYVLYLFHAIDFVDLHQSYRNHPIIPLRYTFEERMNFIESVLNILIQTNGGGLKTSKEDIKAIRH